MPCLQSLVIDRPWRSALDGTHQRSRHRSNRDPRPSFQPLGCLDWHPGHSPATCSMLRSHHHHHVAQAQIPIAPAAPSPSPSRDFVPWPVADAGCWRMPMRRCGRRPQPCTVADRVACRSHPLDRHQRAFPRLEPDLSSDLHVHGPASIWVCHHAELGSWCCWAAWCQCAETTRREETACWWLSCD